MCFAPCSNNSKIMCRFYKIRKLGGCISKIPQFFRILKQRSAVVPTDHWALRLVFAPLPPRTLPHTFMARCTIPKTSEVYRHVCGYSTSQRYRKATRNAQKIHRRHQWLETVQQSEVLNIYSLCAVEHAIPHA